MRLICLSIHHEDTDVATREAVAFTAHETGALLAFLTEQEDIHEALALSTCNRVELYLVTPASSNISPEEELARFKNIDKNIIADKARILEDQQAVRHLFGLVCGVDSMVVGETDILGQVKKAYASALSCDSTGKILNSLFQRAFSIAKQIRSGTAIGKHRVSVASVAADEIARRRDNLAACKVAIWGTGPVGRAAVKALAKLGVTGGTIISRDPRRARELADSWQGEVTTRDEVGRLLQESDVFISATGAPHPVITAQMMKDRQKDIPLLLVDLAVPRDVEPEVGELPSVELIDMDTLSTSSQQGEEERLRAKEEILPLLDQEADTFWNCLEGRLSGQCLAAWRAEAHNFQDEEMARLQSEIKNLPPEMKEKMEAFGHRLLHRLLHTPTEAIAGAMREGLPCTAVLGEHGLQSAGTLHIPISKSVTIAPETLYGVGVGPGSPDQVTLGAIKLLQEVPVIFAASSEKTGQSRAWECVADLLPGKSPVYIPFTMKTPIRQHGWENHIRAATAIGEAIDHHGAAAFITIGDPMTYSTLFYITGELVELRPSTNLEVIPGISSVALAAARTRVPLGIDTDAFCVLPGTVTEEQLCRSFSCFDTIVCLKSYRNREQLLQAFKPYENEFEFFYAAELGTEDETVIFGLENIAEAPLRYMSIIFARRKSAQ